MEEEKERNIGFDVERIIMMFLILIGNWFRYSGVADVLLPSTYQYYVFNIFYAFSLMAFNCLIIGEAYLWVKEPYHSQQIINRLIQVSFYAILSTIILVAARGLNLNWLVFLSALFPLFVNNYWLAAIYILLYACVPFLNLAAQKIGCESTHRHIMVASWILGSVFALVYDTLSGSDIMGINAGLALPWFIILYWTGAYYRLYKNTHYSYGVLLLLFFLGVLITVFSYFIWNYYSPRGAYVRFFFTYNSPFILLSSVVLFLAFEQWRPLSKQGSLHFMSWTSYLIFGPYLATDGTYERSPLWLSFDFVGRLNDWYIVLYVIGICAALLVIGMVVDYARYWLFRPLENNKKIARWCENSIDRRANEIMGYSDAAKRGSSF